jgi:hypothetical protein
MIVNKTRFTCIASTKTSCGLKSDAPHKPVLSSTRNQASGLANKLVLSRAMDLIQQRNNEGKKLISNANFFSVLDDDNVVNKALELGIDASSIHLESIHLMKNLKKAMASLSERKSKKTKETAPCRSSRRTTVA